MTVSQLRRDVKKRINNLSENRLRSAADFIAFLEESSSAVATSMSRRIQKAERQVAQGQVTAASALRRKY